MTPIETPEGQEFVIVYARTESARQSFWEIVNGLSRLDGRVSHGHLLNAQRCNIRTGQR